MNQKMIDEVTKLQAKIVEVKPKKSKLEGSLEEQYKIFFKTYGVKTIEQGEEKIKKLEKEKKIAEEKIDTLYTSLQKKFKW